MTEPATKRGPGRPRVGDGPTERVVVRLPAEVKAALDSEAARAASTPVQVIRDAIDRHLRYLARRAAR